MKTKKTLWKLHHIKTENGELVLDQLVSRDDEIMAEFDLMNYREKDMNREDPSAEYEFEIVANVRSWYYECDEYVRNVRIYSVEIEVEEE